MHVSMLQEARNKITVRTADSSIVPVLVLLDIGEHVHHVQLLDRNICQGSSMWHTMPLSPCRAWGISHWKDSGTSRDSQETGAVLVMLSVWLC